MTRRRPSLGDQAEQLARLEASAQVPAGETPMAWRNLALAMALGLDTKPRRLVVASGARIGGRTSLTVTLAPAEEQTS